MSSIFMSSLMSQVPHPSASFFFLLLYIVIADHFVLKLFFQYKWHRLPVKLWVLSFLCKVEHEIPNEP